MERDPSRTSARTVGALASAALLVVALGACAAGGDESLPATDLVTLEGGAPASLADYAGRPLVVNLWATWCTPCKTEMPAIQRVADRFGEEVAIVGVTDDPDRDAALEAAHDAGARYTLLSDPSMSFQSAMEVPGLPATVFVSPDGRILERHLGALTDDELTEKIGAHYGLEA